MYHAEVRTDAVHTVLNALKGASYPGGPVSVVQSGLDTIRQTFTLHELPAGDRTAPVVCTEYEVEVTVSVRRTPAAG